jgi:hypothetical protein
MATPEQPPEAPVVPLPDWNFVLLETTEPDLMPISEVMDRYAIKRPQQLYRFQAPLKWLGEVARTQRGQKGNGHKAHLYNAKQRLTIGLAMSFLRLGLAEAEIAQLLGLPGANTPPTQERLHDLLTTLDREDAMRVEQRAVLHALLAWHHGHSPEPQKLSRRRKGVVAKTPRLHQRATAAAQLITQRVHARTHAPSKQPAKKPRKTTRG